MPSIDIAGTSPTSPEHLDRPFFRSHKSLPRKSDVAPTVHVIHISPSDHDGDDPSNGAALATAPALPLTPPGISQDETPPAVDWDMQKAASSHSVAGVMTPSKPSHPPTPETTPPRLTPSVYRPGLNQFGQTPSSSRAESFQTACERISDGETETPRRSSQSLKRSTSQRTPQRIERTGSHTRTGEVGSDKLDDTPKSSKLEVSSKGLAGSNNGEYTAIPSRRQKRRADRSPATISATDTSKQPRDKSATSSNSLEVPRTRGRSLRNRVHDVPNTTTTTTTPSVEQFRDTIGCPSVDRRADTTDPDDTRRHSGVSTSSTVEAMIIESERPAKRTLRHSEKRVSLRSASSPITKSERSSLGSNPESQRRLVHKIARITESDRRRSITSEFSTSGSSTLGVPPQNVEVVPVIVIPERRSSLKFTSASTSKMPSKSSRRSSRRAPTASSSRNGSLDLPRPKKRTMSDPTAPALQRTESRGRGSGRPIIPPRSSSLSAPTSQNNSHAASLTSDSLRNHSQAMDLEERKKPADPLTPAKDTAGPDLVPDYPKTQSILIGVEDMAHLRPPSVPFTPGSIPSSSPGPIEINEATTVVFFPHNNESLLLVDPQLQSAFRRPMTRVAYRSSLGKPQTPEVYVHDQLSGGDMGSPLKNPRRPPEPPVCKVTPSTPVNEVDRQLGEPNNKPEPNERPTRGFGSVRRPWMVRPRSESFGSFARSLSLKSATTRKPGKEDIDDKLHPFWRPRRFWEDSSDETEEESPREEVPRSMNPEPDQVISNSVGLPQPRVILEGPPLSRRSPEMKHLFDGTVSRHHGSRGALGVFNPEAIYSQASLHHRHLRPLSWWRLRLRLGPVRDLRRRLRRKMARRAEGKREARRERLKQSIGEAVLVDSSTQTRSIAL